LLENARAELVAARCGDGGGSGHTHTTASRLLFDVAFVDADKKSYLTYVQELVGDTLDLGAADIPGASAEAGVDAGAHAESRAYKEPLLREGALIIVDNTLWKGLVLAVPPAVPPAGPPIHAGTTDVDTGVRSVGTAHADLSCFAPPPELYGDARRMRSLAAAMHAFNVAVSTGGVSGQVQPCGRRFSLTPIMLPLRDGLTLLRFSSVPGS
jgi:hypothetical protein